MYVYIRIYIEQWVSCSSMLALCTLHWTLGLTKPSFLLQTLSGGLPFILGFVRNILKLLHPLLQLNISKCPSTKFTQAASETQTRLSPPTCTCPMTVATRGGCPSRAPIIMPYWTLEACWWLWSTPTPHLIKSSESTRGIILVVLVSF